MRNTRLLVTAVALGMLVVPAQAYYHYVFFSGRSGPFTPINAHYDLSKLSANTVVFCVNDTGPTAFFPNDSFPSVVSEIKQAIGALNAIPNSALHVAFGGLEYAGQNANTPGGNVVFQDLGPGLLGLATPNLPAVPQFSTSGNTPFVPINRSTVVLTNNTSTLPGPSYLEMFYTTAVHEFGHALGLQHTWTGSAMSQDVVRNTSRARPLEADDIAGFLELYGTPTWTNYYGSISGRVTYSNGTAVAMASVVAIPNNGPAVSALTNPDGSYTINGLTPNSYLLYVHPLPPDAIPANGSGLLLPSDQSGQSFPAGGAFRTVFYPNTLNPSQATPMVINGATNLSGQNFTVQAQASVPAYDLLVTSYADTTAHNYTYAPTSNYQLISPAFLNTAQGAVQFRVQANPPQTLTVPQSIAILGVGTGFNCAVQNILPCFNPFDTPTQLAGYFGLSTSMGTGPRHMVFNFGNDIYVMPNGVIFVQQGPPFINSVSPNGDGTVTLSGGNYGPDSRVFFDGIQAIALPGASASSLSVTAPSGMSGQQSTVTVFNADGQNSMQFYLQPQNAPTFQYGSLAVPQLLSVSPTSMPSGNSGAPYSTMIDITAINTNFVDGQVSVAGGSSDITVTRVWVLSPSHLMANVSVASGAALGTTELSVISGFQVLTIPFQIQPPNGVMPLISGILGADSYQPTVYRNGYGAIYGVNLQAASQATVSLNGQPVPVVFSSSGQVNFGVPASFPTGPLTLTLSNGSGSVNILVPVGNLPPTVQSISNSQGGPVDAGHPAIVGDVLTALVSGIDPSTTPALSRIQATVSGLPMTVLQISPAANAQFQVQFVLAQSFGGSQVPVTIGLDGSASNPFPIAAR